MACNCGDGCGCRVIGGSGATVTGDGSQTNPYVVSSNAFQFAVEDTDCINLDLTGSGTNTDPYTIQAFLDIHPSTDNILVCDGDGLLVDCDTVVTCVGNNLGCGLEFNNGLICVMISEEPGNQIDCLPDGLYASFDCDDLGCGLTLDGDGNIAVNVGTPGNTKRGLICDPNTGVVGIDVLDCVTEPGGRSGLTITGPGQLALDAPQIRDAIVVGRRDAGAVTPIPGAAIGGNGGVGNGICTNVIDPIEGQAVIVRNNPHCYRMTGWTTLQAQFELRIYPGTDVEVVLEQSIDGAPFVVRDKIFRRYLPASAHGGDPDEFEIVSEFYTRMDINTIPASSFTTLGYRMCFRRTPTDNGDQSTNFRADILAFSMTAANLYAWDR